MALNDMLEGQKSTKKNSNINKYRSREQCDVYENWGFGYPKPIREMG